MKKLIIVALVATFVTAQVPAIFAAKKATQKEQTAMVRSQQGGAASGKIWTTKRALAAYTVAALAIAYATGYDGGLVDAAVSGCQTVWSYMPSWSSPNEVCTEVCKVAPTAMNAVNKALGKPLEYLCEYTVTNADTGEIISNICETVLK